MSLKPPEARQPQSRAISQPPQSKSISPPGEIMGAAKNARAIALHGKAPQRAAKQTNCASSPQRCSRKALSTNFTARGNLGQGRREKHTPNAAGASDEGNRRKPTEPPTNHISSECRQNSNASKKSRIKRTRTKFKRTLPISTASLLPGPYAPRAGLLFR